MGVLGSSFVLLVLCLFLHVSVHAWMIRYKDDKGVDDNEILDTPTQRMNVIYPGTKWCGSGNVANNPDDLGKFAETDACCRDHDMCPDIIKAHESNHGLTNPTFYTRLNCSCDEKFYDCLRESKDGAGDKVGFLYFSVLNTKCFRKDYPIVGCKRKSYFRTRCLEYELDDSQPMRYQWFDVPLYL